MADFTFFEAVDFYNWASEGKLFATYPTLEAYHKRVASLPKVDEYLASDRSKKRFNNKSAKLNNFWMNLAKFEDFNILSQEFH